MDGNENGIGEGGREANKRKKPHMSCRRDVKLFGANGAMENIIISCDRKS